MKKRELPRKIQESLNRRAERRSIEGYRFEERVSLLLEHLKNESIILDFIRHPHHSAEDTEGKDFTITGLQNGLRKEFSFGVTISMHSWHKGKVKHPDIKQLCFPIGTNIQTIKQRIIEFFVATS